MGIGSAFSSALQGYQVASVRVTDATAAINEQRVLRQLESEPLSSQSPLLEQSAVELVAAPLAAQANLKSIETADEMLGAIIDIRV